MEKIVIVGAGGFGREVEWLIRRVNEVMPTYEMIGFVDDGKKNGESVGHSKVICTVDELVNYDEKINVCIAVGNAKTRKEIVDKLSVNKNIVFPNLIDPSVIYYEDELTIGKGNIVCAGTILTVNITMGDFNIINLDCTVGHDDVIRDYVTMYPSVNVSGCVEIDDCVEIGTGTQIIQGLSIKNDVIVGAGAAVVKNLEEPGVYVGIPAKKIK